MCDECQSTPEVRALRDEITQLTRKLEAAQTVKARLIDAAVEARVEGARLIVQATEELRVENDQLHARWKNAMGMQEEERERRLRLRALLRTVEWVGDGTNLGFDVCPICKRYRMQGHASKCEMAAALEDRNA